MGASPKRPLTTDEAEAIRMLRPVSFPVGSWDKRFAHGVLNFALSTGEIGEASVPQLWRIFIRYRRQTSGPRKAILLANAENLSAPDFRKQQAAARAQARVDAAKAKYATAMRDGYEVPLIGIPKNAEPSKGDFRNDTPQPL